MTRAGFEPATHRISERHRPAIFSEVHERIFRGAVARPPRETRAVWVAGCREVHQVRADCAAHRPVAGRGPVAIFYRLGVEEERDVARMLGPGPADRTRYVRESVFESRHPGGTDHPRKSMRSGNHVAAGAADVVACGADHHGYVREAAAGECTCRIDRELSVDERP